MSRFRKYEGGDPLAPPVDLAEALDDRPGRHGGLLAGARDAGVPAARRPRPGRLDDLARRVAERRRDPAAPRPRRHPARGPELLDQAVLAERGQLARDITMDDTDRAFRELSSTTCRPRHAAAVSELSSYDWQSSEAREAFEQIKDLLGRELLDQRFAGMKQALEGATEEDRQAVQEMLSDLNDLLEKHAGEGITDEEFRDFMDKHGDYFPETRRTWTSCSTRSPSARPRRSGCSTR